MNLPVVVLLGPCRGAMSGVSAHLNLLFASRLGGEYSLVHFQVGSEGRSEGAVARLARLLASPWKLAAALLARRAAIVHVNSGLTARAYWRDLAYMMVAKICGARVLYQVHGGALPQEFFGRSRILAAFLRATLMLPDAIVVLARSELMAYRRFLPRRRVLLLPNGVDCASIAVPARERAAAGAPLRLVYIGRLAEGKGLHEALQGLKLVRAQGIRAQLAIAGGGPQEESLRQLACILGLGGDVSFVGPVFGEGKMKLLRDADALVLASYAEGLPYALLESMAAGVPVIATPVGAIPDVVADGVHGLLVAPRDAAAIARAIRTLASDRDLIEAMRKACRQRVAAVYSIDRLAGELRTLYADLCASGLEKGGGRAWTRARTGRPRLVSERFRRR